MNNKIYVASSWRNKYQPKVVQRLREAGFDVYDFRNPYEGYNGFHWSEIDKNWKNWTPRDFMEGLDHSVSLTGFSADKTAMVESDCCVLVEPCGRSAHLEAGWMIGRGKYTTIYLPEKIEPELMFRFADYMSDNLDNIIGNIKWIQDRCNNPKL